MKRIFRMFPRLVLAFSIAALFTSCKKLIEIPSNPSDKIPTEQAFSDSTNVLNVLSGIYNNFQIVDYGAAPTFFNGGLSVYTGLSGDELINRDVSLILYLSPFYNNSVLPNDGYLSSMWSDAYKVIYTINISLQSIQESPGVSPHFKQMMTGELKFMRAWVNFNLVNLFGGIPIITATDFNVNATLPRETQQKVLESIISDLEEANSILVADYPSDGRARPNVYAVKALLAKAYLFTENWQKAESLASEVINSGLYALETDLNNVFLHGSTEAIWQYPTEGASFSQTNEAYTFVPDPFSGDGVPKFEMTPSLYNAFEPDDNRRLNWTAAQDVNGTIYNYPLKYKNRDVTDGIMQEDYMFLRLAEQYLIRAEARARLDLLEVGLEDMNVVRRRAGLADKSLSGKEALLSDILDERRVELFCEWANRWFDLKRLNKIDEVMGAKPNWEPTDALYPIPLGELQRNPFLTQNPGY
ncbi:MAG: RagB/SusD family nutrient uptake outer membrane protein [Chitinophagaceae bacterium]|nr:RagB/SusD family nutrient uptake outer membrane protein [Chitinophagaceae bacterium]